MNDGSIVDCDSPAKLCDVTERKKVAEPYVANPNPDPDPDPSPNPSPIPNQVTEPYVAMEIFCPQVRVRAYPYPYPYP